MHSYAPASLFSTRPIHRLPSGRVRSRRPACKGWPARSHSTMGAGSPVAWHRRATSSPDLAVTSCGSTWNTGAPVGGPGQFLETFYYFQIFKRYIFISTENTEAERITESHVILQANPCASL